MMNELITTNNNVTIFDNPEFGQMRTIFRDGEPWFVAADVCRALEIVETHRALSRLDDDEKGSHLMTTPGGLQELSVVNEPGLYTLVLGSRKPEAKRFKRWVTHDVIPTIRKTGSYSLAGNRANLSPTMKLMYGMLDELASTQEKMLEVDKKATQAITAANSAVKAADTITDNLHIVIDAIKRESNWRSGIVKRINKIAETTNTSYDVVWSNAYKELDSRARCRVNDRLTRRRRRMRVNGSSETDIRKLRKIDIVESDSALKEIFNIIVAENVIKYCVKGV